MAKKTSKPAGKATTKATKARATEEEIRWPFGPRNYLVFALALVVIIVGYITLGSGSMTLAPFLLVVGYCVLIPVAILIKGKPETAPTTPDQNASDQPQA